MARSRQPSSCDVTGFTPAYIRYMLSHFGINHPTARVELAYRFIKRSTNEDTRLEDLAEAEIDEIGRGLDQIYVDEDLIGTSDILQTALLHQRECYKQDKRREKNNNG